MVVESGFAVELHDPDTGKAHKEFVNSDGKVFVEAHPGAQYFIDVKLVDRSGVKNADKICAHFIVDKKDLGFRQNIPMNGSVARAGIKLVDGDRGALAFTIPKIKYVDTHSSQAGSHADFTESFCGSVIVCIHESVLATAGSTSSACPTAASLFSARISPIFRPTTTANLDIPAQEENVFKDKKLMRSTAGTAVLNRQKPRDASKPVQNKPVPAATKTKNTKKVTKTYQRGPHIATITVNYCSTVGLIAVGVLPKPYPGWNPNKAGAVVAALPSSMDLAKVVSDKISYKDSNGLKHEAFHYDLTGLSDEDEERGGEKQKEASPEKIRYKDDNGLKHEAIQYDFTGP